MSNSNPLRLADVELVSALHENPTYLPSVDIHESLRFIALVFAGLCAATAVAILAIRRLRLCAGPKKSPAEVSAAEWTAAYRTTSIVMNGLLGATGLYHFFFSLPPDTTTPERIEGFEAMAVLANMQIAYQIWAVPMGAVFVNEPKEMLFHHMAVMVVGSLSAFFTNGFRYHNPFFFGLIETSSVPLVVMNIFKDYPSLSRKHPVLNVAVSLTFCITFLVTRVFMWFPQAADFVRITFLMGYTSDDLLCKIGLGSAISACFFLTALQLYWAGKIISGILEFVTGKKVD